ncbi:MAG: type II secretion system protein [Thiobacillus sp.]
MSSKHPFFCRGFTLIEMIIAITVLGILSASTAVFLRGPIASYFDTERRASLSDAGELALAKLTQDVSRANPGSITSTPLGAGFSLNLVRRPATGSLPTQSITYVCSPNSVNPALGTLKRGTDLLATNLILCPPPFVSGPPQNLVTLVLGFDNAGDRLTLYHAIRVDLP